MKAKEFIIEATVNKKKYIAPINQLLSQPEVNLPVQPKANSEVVDFFPTPGQLINSLDDPIQGELNGELQTFPAKKVYKSNEIKTLAGSVSNINKGELVEGYHAAAAFARLIKRPLNDITIDDVLNIISKLENGKPLVLKEKEVDSTIADRFELTIKLKPGSWDALKNPNTVEEIGTIIDSIIIDANQETARYAEKFATNQRYDVARVIGDGISEESSSKTDVSFENEAEQKFAGYSLKVGTNKQVHQVGAGATADTAKSKKATPAQRFYIVSQKLFAVDGKFPIANIESVKPQFLQAATPEEMQQIAYQAAVDSLNANLQTDDQEKQFMRTLVGAMQYWMGRDDPDIKVKQFTTSGTSILDPRKINSLIDNDQIDLVATYSLGASDLPKVTISDKNTNEKLVSIRTYRTESGYIRNYIEKEPLWVKLTLLKHIPNKPPKPTAAAPEAPIENPQDELATIKKNAGIQPT